MLCREAGAEQKFKEISNAYEVKIQFCGNPGVWFMIQLWKCLWLWFKVIDLSINLPCRCYQMMRSDLYMTSMEKLDLKVLVWAWG